jgi:hypothetical protein
MPVFQFLFLVLVCGLTGLCRGSPAPAELLQAAIVSDDPELYKSVIDSVSRLPDVAPGLRARCLWWLGSYFFIREDSVNALSRLVAAKNLPLPAAEKTAIGCMTAYLFLQKNDLGKCLAAIRDLLSAVPGLENNSYLFFCRAEAYYRQGDIELAEPDFLWLLQDEVPVYHNLAAERLAAIYAQEGRSAEQQEILRKYPPPVSGHGMVPKPPPEAQVPLIAGSFTIQLGAFQVKRNADFLRDKYAKLGRKIVIQGKNVEGKQTSLFTVALPDFLSMEEARIFAVKHFPDQSYKILTQK